MRNKNPLFMVTLLGLVALCGLGSGCATTGYTQQNSSASSCYDQFFSSYGDYRVVRKGSHLVRQKMDCTENIEIPYENYSKPNSELLSAHYSKDGKYILWSVQNSGCFRIDSNLDTKTIQKIDGNEYFNLLKGE